jgi:hypothetical protein
VGYPVNQPHVVKMFNADTAFWRVLDRRIGGVQESKVG